MTCQIRDNERLGIGIEQENYMKLKDVEKIKFDTRMADINLKARVITQQDVDKKLSELEDLSSECVHLEFEHDGNSGSAHTNQ
jgi:hypothetical protein